MDGTARPKRPECCTTSSHKEHALVVARLRTLYEDKVETLAHNRQRAESHAPVVVFDGDGAAK